MTERKVGGYIWRQELARAVRANRLARRALKQVLEDEPHGVALMWLLANVAQYLGDERDALAELQQIRG